MEKIVEQGILYDFYGELLTEHQRQIYEDAVFNDMSLSELADSYGISRQGVHDLLKRCDKMLLSYESKLHLVERFDKIKGKIRQRMMQASQRRMMQDLPKADVVITNPTHFAVAIKYDADLYDAPYVVAKGSDHLAAKIKEVAKENKVEIVENKPLARMLYYNVELGAVIPPELYKAVADILAMVYKMQGKI